MIAVLITVTTRYLQDVKPAMRIHRELVSNFFRTLDALRGVLANLTLALFLVVVNPFVQAQTFTVLHAFHSSPDGASPYGGLVLDRAGNVYGITFTGGPYGNGVIYKVDPAGNETILHRLSHHEGCCSFGNLLMDKAGNLYGTTYEAGSSNSGTVFQLTHAGKLVVLHEFGQGGGSEEGGRPWAGVIRDNEGNLYGTTSFGALCCGNVFTLDHKTKDETVLYAFGQPPDGGTPVAPLIRDDAGNLYGTTDGGGLCCGTVFTLDPNGVETILWTFTGGSDGKFPLGGLIRDNDGNLYGTTNTGGDLDNGIVFKLDPAGALTVLHTFGELPVDGGIPFSGLIADAAGNLYGTTEAGGLYGPGSVYKLAPDGAFTILHSFTGGSDGAFPHAPLIFDAAGNLYGTAISGGDPLCDCGVVFKITP
jgi:uncharacterized repeat protein (TIGR03803 family)